jgi:uncharacterized protein DUF1638
MKIDDHALTEKGLSARPGGRGTKSVLLIACGALAREILALIEANNWRHMELRCLPAKLHLYPKKIPAEVERTVLDAGDRYESIFVIYADCGTGGLLAAKCDELGVQMIPGPHCYSFFDGNQSFARNSEDEMRAFYLTDFLVRQFDAFVWKPMGLDRHPELRDMLFGNYTTLVYLAQTQTPELDRLAEAAAQRLGLDYVRRFTGYGDLAVTLAAFAGTAQT